MHLFQGNKGAKVWKWGEQGHKENFWGTGNIGNDDFDFGQQGNKAIQSEQDKINKMIRAHGEDEDQPGIYLRFLRADSELWSDRVDAQDDLSLHLAHRHFVGFVMRRLNQFLEIKGIDSPGREKASCIPLKWLALLYGGSCSCHFMRTKLQVQYMQRRRIA